MGAAIELVGGNRPGLEWILRIQNPNMLSPFEMAIPAREEALDWMAAIKETVKNASVRVNVGKCQTKLSFFPDSYFIYLFICLHVCRKIKRKKKKEPGE